MSDRHRHHLEVCPLCREVAQEAAVTPAVLNAAARWAADRDPVALPKELKARVRRQALARLGADPAAEPATGPPTHFTVRTEADDPIPGWLDRLGSVFGVGMGRRMAWSCTILIAVGLVALIGVRRGGGGPIGQIDYAAPLATLHQGGDVFQQKGLASKLPIHRHARIETAGDARAIAQLGEGARVRMTLDRGTEVRVAQSRHIELVKGSVWVRVEPEGKGFRVKTPNAVIEVTGTRFGVTVDQHQTRVDVAKGTVMVGRPAAEGRVELNSGFRLVVSGQGALKPMPRELGDALPGWVRAVLAKEDIAVGAAYLPSLQPKSPTPDDR